MSIYQDYLNSRKAIKDVKSKAKVEAEKIFVKNNQTGPLTKYKNKATGLYPKVDETSPNEYRKEVERTENFVVKTRLNQYKNSKKK